MNQERLIELSQMMMGGQMVYKFDHIATIHINDYQFFNVYRRYNSPYNIIIEDYNGDIHLHQDHTVRISLKTVLCLSDYESNSLYTYSAESYKYNGPIPYTTVDVADMRWTEIHTTYQGVNVHFRGIYNEFIQQLHQTYQQEQYIPQTPLQPIQPVQQQVPPQPHKLSVTIPAFNDEMDKTDEPTLSMRFTDILKRKGYDHRSNSCYCAYSADDEESEEDDNYMVLRNGTIVRKNT
jgi:hypothetical protein